MSNTNQSAELLAETLIVMGRQVYDAREETAIVKISLENVHSTVTKYSSELDRYQKLLVDAQHKLSRQIGNYEDVQELKEKIKVLELTIEQHIVSYQKMTDKRNELQNELVNLPELKSRLEIYKADNDRYRTANQDIRQQLDTTIDDCARMSQMLVMLKNEYKVSDAKMIAMHHSLFMRDYVNKDTIHTVVKPTARKSKVIKTVKRKATTKRKKK